MPDTSAFANMWLRGCRAQARVQGVEVPQARVELYVNGAEGAGEQRFLSQHAPQHLTHASSHASHVSATQTWNREPRGSNR
eukprot:7382541-Prymnesium_polylepis.2